MRIEIKFSTRLEQKDGNLSHVEVDEVLGFVCDVRSEVTSNNAVPGGVVLLVELLFDVGSDILLDIELLKSNVRAINGILLHFLIHVCVLDDGLPLSG